MTRLTLGVMGNIRDRALETYPLYKSKLLLLQLVVQAERNFISIKQFQAGRHHKLGIPTAITEPDSKQNIEAGPAMKILSQINY